MRSSPAAGRGGVRGGGARPRAGRLAFGRVRDRAPVHGVVGVQLGLEGADRAIERRGGAGAIAAVRGRGRGPEADEAEPDRLAAAARTSSSNTAFFRASGLRGMFPRAPGGGVPQGGVSGLQVCRASVAQVRALPQEIATY